ncbi:MAG: hypothetical protein P1P87_02395 [Trueperaceae bacterium]|nr:hypothetical protein [Trueperaceae bacterium]
MPAASTLKKYGLRTKVKRSWLTNGAVGIQGIMSGRSGLLDSAA